MHRTPDREYLKGVADILKRTGHPRQEEVLEDLRSHLEELTLHEDAPANLDALEERLGSPEEYAENLAPATGHAMKSLLHRRSFRLGAAAALVMIALTVVATNNRYLIAAKYREALGQNFNSTPFFDLERMRNLEVGATAEEIRDAIGYPFRRFRLVGSDNEVHWVYTDWPSRYAPFCTWAKVITDADEMSLIRLQVTKMVRNENLQANRVMHPPASVDVGIITFSRPDGHKLVIQPSDEKVYVITRDIGVSSADDLNLERIQRREAYVTSTWKNVPRENVRFVHIVEPRGKMKWPGLNDLLKELPTESPIYSNMSMSHDSKNRGARVGNLVYEEMVYSDGTLYFYPLLYSDISRIEEAYRNDQNWLMHRLLSREN